MREDYMKLTAPVFNVQTYSIHDGPGIRVTVFLKGCPLRCLWCANPESNLATPQLMTYGTKCSGCGRWFTKKSGTKEIKNKDAYSIPPTGHEYGEWIPDGEDGHVRYCEHENCGEFEEGSHVYQITVDTAERTTTYTCTVCGYTEEMTWEEEHVEVPDDTPIPPEDAPLEEKEDTIIQEDVKDKELDIAHFGLLQLRYKTVTQNSVTLVWNKVEGAKAYYLYGSLCAKLEVPVYAPLSTSYFVSGMKELEEKSTLHAPLQWSIGAGLGLQYNLTSGIGLFAEPSLQYYIPTGSDIETHRTEHPFAFSLPLGIRITW